MELDTITHLLIDGDGVLYKRNDPLPGFDALFAALAKRDIGWALLTNNATRDVSDYVEKLGALGVEATEGQIFSSARATAETLKARYAEGDHLYVIGMQGLVDSLEAAGFVCHQGDDVPDQPVRAVVTALDLDITYGKIAAAMHLIRAGAAFIATNPDLTFPTPEGLYPGAGTIVAAVEAASGVEPEVIGKPEKAIFEAALGYLGADRAHAAVVGDRLNTDILGGQAVGIGTILVMSGVTTPEELAESDIQPDVVMRGIDELAEALNAL